jgi:hypothetical protein
VNMLLVEEYKKALKKEKDLQKVFFNAPDFEKDWRRAEFEKARDTAKELWKRICKGER